MTSHTPGESGPIRASTLSSLNAIGHVPWTDFAYIYLEQKKLKEAEIRLTVERDDLTAIYGADDIIVMVLMRTLARIYAVQGR
jgi:hypothetical protein